MLNYEILERVLGIEIAAIDYANKQQTVQTLPGYKGIRLDVYVEDIEGNVYDIEMQTSTVAALGKRCRYYHSEMDSYAIHKGVEYKDLKKSIVIFVCTFDPFKENRSVYTFQNTCQEVPGRILEDDSETIIYHIPERFARRGDANFRFASAIAAICDVSAQIAV